nr:14562_t:CDS:1 [Entrophospora candida]
MLTLPSLPFEIVNMVVEYNKDDYGALFSWLLVSKLWYNIIIPILWKDPCYCDKSFMTIIKCLMVEDQDFFVKNKICYYQKVRLSDLPQPLHNYARFATILDLEKIRKAKPDILKARVVDFLLKYTRVRVLKITKAYYKGLVEHKGFNTIFKDIQELSCHLYDDPIFFDRLAVICRNIESLKITIYNSTCGLDESLARLIKNQKKIKSLIICPSNKITFSEEFQQAIAIHSNSIIHYESSTDNNIDILIESFRNLKSLKLISHNKDSYSAVNKISRIKFTNYPNLEKVNVKIHKKIFLLDMAEFINTNGSNLNTLIIDGRAKDKESLNVLIESIAENCHKLEVLSIFYNDEQDEQFINLLNNCTKLKSITLDTGNLPKKKKPKIAAYNGNNILALLNQTLPKSLKTLTFNKPADLSDNSLWILTNNWKGPRPFIIKRHGSKDYYL